MIASYGAGDEPRVGGKVLVGAHVDQGRRIRRADQAGKFVRCYGSREWHGCALVKETGRDTWACRLMGGSQAPIVLLQPKPAPAVNVLGQPSSVQICWDNVV